MPHKGIDLGLQAQLAQRVPDHIAALAYYPVPLRAAAVALMGVTDELRAIPEKISEPMLGAIRLQWWRDAMAEVYDGGTPRGHPVVQAIHRELGARPDLKSAILDMIDSTEAFLEPAATATAEVIASVHEGRLALLLARLIEPDTDHTKLFELASLCGAYRSLCCQQAGQALRANNSAPINPHGIEAPGKRLQRLYGTPGHISDIRQRAQRAWAACTPFPAPLACVYAPLKGMLAYTGIKPPSVLSQRLRLFITVLRGR